MRSSTENSRGWKMLELPGGITTSEGNWYHITEEGIRTYVPGLLKEYSLERLIKDADAWINSTGGISLLLFFILLLVGVNVYLSVGMALVFYTIWKYNVSAFIRPVFSPVIRLANNDGVIYLLSAAVLIYFAADELYTQVWTGLAMVFLLKVGLLKLFFRWLEKSGKDQEEKVSLSDRVLNMILIRYGMKKGILTGGIREMESKLIEMANYHKKKKD